MGDVRRLDVPVSELGEGPIWDEESQSLIWVDITRPVVHRSWPELAVIETYSTPSPVGSVCLTDDDRFVLALQDGFWLADRTLTEFQPLAIVHEGREELRFNDGKCDPGGRFWAGTMDFFEAPGAGSLYRLDGRSATVVLEGVTVSNGIDWSPDGRLMYYVDSPTQAIRRFPFDAASGSIGPGEDLLHVEAEDGTPDGLTVDSEGHIWVALWGGSRVRRYAPDGTLEAEVLVPVSQVTSCTFGGADLGELFITSAQTGLTAEQRANQPLAGSVFVTRPGIVGRPSRRMSGHTLV